MGRRGLGGVVAPVPAIAVSAAALALGWTVAWTSAGLRLVVPLVSGIRANGLAFAIAQASFPSRLAVHAAVVTFGAFSVVLPVATAFMVVGWRKRPGSGTTITEPGRPPSANEEQKSPARRVGWDRAKIHPGLARIHR